MRNKTSIGGMALLALATAAGAGAANAQSASPPPPPPPPSFSPAPRFTSGDSAFEFKIRGRVQMDAFTANSDFVQNAGDEDYRRTASRRVRLGAEGRMSSKFRYRTELEMNRSAVTWTDVFIEYVGSDYSLIIGNQKGVTTLDEKTSDPVNLFTERAAYANAFQVGQRRLGVVYTRGGPNWSFDAGVFGDDINAAETANRDEAYAVAARLTYAPIFQLTPDGAHVLHVGGYVRYRDQGDDAWINPTARPAESNFTTAVLNPGFATTGTGATAGISSDTTYEAEFAYIRGPVGMHGEYSILKGDRANGADVEFSGGFVDVFYQLTGESRQIRQGEFRRMVPAQSIVDGGPGLWQIGARYDTLTLTDGAGACGVGKVCGGTQSTIAGVVNWQPIEWIKFSGQYAYSDIRGANGGVGATRRDGNANTFQLRAAMDF